jgi:ComF family protein
MALINDFLSLIYPRYCNACSAVLFGHERFLCRHCLLSLPRSNYHLSDESELLRVFTGRVPLTRAACCFLYERRGKVQQVLHAIKYHGQKELAVFLGERYGKELAGAEVFGEVDLVVPVPLHKNRQRLRGFNQSECFARGLAGALGKELDTVSLERVLDPGTQTRKKGKFERWENVEGIFRLSRPAAFENKHILLADDVVTTGATVEACWLAMKQVPGVRLSLVSIAFAPKQIPAY